MNQLHHSAIDALAAEVAVVDCQGVILSQNTAWGTSHPGSPLVGGACREQTNYLDWCLAMDNPLALHARELAEGIRGVLDSTRDDFFLEYAGTDGDVPSWFTVRVTPFHDDGSARAVVVHEDITEYKQLQTQLSQAQKLETIGQLAAGIAHEINTPMQYIGDNIEWLYERFNRVFEIIDLFEQNLEGTGPKKTWQERRDEIDELYRRYDFHKLRDRVTEAIGDCREGFQRVSSITRAMKDFSHPGKADRQSIDLNELIAKATVITRNRWKYAASLQTDLAADLPNIDCYVAEISQVLINLIVNAADAVAEKSGEGDEASGEIRIATGDDGEAVIIEISDTGCGIPEAIRKRVFDPFFTTKEVGRGTGQGLAICYNVVVKLHGGTIDLHSTPGRGTTVSVRLPKRAPKREHDETRTQTEQHDFAGAVPAVEFQGVDDDMIG